MSGGDEWSHSDIMKRLDRIDQNIETLARANNDMAVAQASANATAETERRALRDEVKVLATKVDGHGTAIAQARGGLSVGRWVFGIAVSLGGVAVARWVYDHWKEVMEYFK